jgi:UDP-N-acetylmuramyl pentapeptide phosphotransferase/UDP-N-acetylglucosamine-1-phosphate transferase
MIYTYILIFIILFIILLLYFRIAVHYSIVDIPNNRSSHTVNTISGGGIIFPFAMILYVFFFNEISHILLAGIFIISMISFIDDIFPLSIKARIPVHFLSAGALLFSVEAYHTYPIWILPFAFIIIIGATNVYNFMDGINGITGLYSLIVLASLFYMNEFYRFTDPAFIHLAMMSCLIFLFFNFRKRAMCFAGDVGSISIGFWIISLLLLLIIRTGDLNYILFLAVYGVDAVLTIIHRLFLKHNILEAHRFHFYQILVNERKMPHLAVAFVYSVVQLSINVFIITTSYNFLLTCAIATAPLVIFYVLLKPMNVLSLLPRL